MCVYVRELVCVYMCTPACARYAMCVRVCVLCPTVQVVVWEQIEKMVRFKQMSSNFMSQPHLIPLF